MPIITDHRSSTRRRSTSTCARSSALPVPEGRRLQLRQLDQAEGGHGDGRARRARRIAHAQLDPGRVLVGKPRRRPEHDRREQGLPVHVRHRLALQPRHHAADAALGTQVHTITEPLPTAACWGPARPRPRAVRLRPALSVAEPVRQPGNSLAHFRVTAPAIAREFPDLDVLFVGAGTSGTLMGCARWMREWRPKVRIVAIDTVGSVIFGGPPAAG